ATVAVPAYINYVNRTKQGEAESLLMTARMEEAEYYAENQQYASTIQCLPSFANGNTQCLSTCSNPACANNYTGHYYSFMVSGFQSGSGGTQPYFQIQAQRPINNTTDTVTISATTDTPTVQTPAALNFSIFQWLFGQ
ncbi:MAG: type IV pilin protein, partial [Syntrophobacteraceae bacterium]